MPDREGRPMHSWRVAILPYLEQTTLFNAYNFYVPWNAAANVTVANAQVSVFTCPSDLESDRLHTDYCMITGPGTLHDPQRFGNPGLRDITDGTSYTIIVAEVANSGIHWLDPRVVTIDLGPSGYRSIDNSGLRINGQPGRWISSHHPGGANVLFADGSVLFLKENVQPTTLKALLTPQYGEVIDRSSY
jgi:prepilin-type processing-associated H-X9-DG protein